ncbi:hypothetical protein Sjap_025794 [Stephania japonica]|uniref:Uncharacterized protein n=1 Tax=Stephania japonica TaxID=461633 RepID=A0AAP0E5I0_9MAGN
MGGRRRRQWPEKELTGAKRRRADGRVDDNPSRSRDNASGAKQMRRRSRERRSLPRQESYFAYLFGVVEPGFYGAIASVVDSSIIGRKLREKSYFVYSILFALHETTY